MKKKIICYMVALIMLIPILYMVGCGKKYTPQQAVNYVSAEITNKYNNRLITSRDLQFVDTMESGDQIVKIEYKSDNERIVNNQGIAYPIRTSQSVDVLVKVSCEDYEKSFKIFINIPGSDWENNNVVNDTRLDVYMVLESAWPIWDNDRYINRYQFKVYNNLNTTITCFHTLNGNVLLNNSQLSNLKVTHTHDQLPITHDTKSWEFGYPRNLASKATTFFIVDDSWASNDRIYTKADQMTFAGNLTWYID